MRNAVSAVTGAFEAKSRTPNEPKCARRASMTTPQTIPGILLLVAYARKSRSISGIADSSRAMRLGSENRGVG